MKIKTVKHQKYKLLELNLLKSTEVKKKFDLCFVSLLRAFVKQNVEIRLKYALKIIYTYHVSDFKILFLGVPNKNARFLKRLSNTTGHYFIPYSPYLKDITQNKNSITKILRKKRMNIGGSRKPAKKEENKLEKPKLIVFMNESVNKPLLKKIRKMRIPFIYLTAQKMWLIENEQETFINSSCLTIKHGRIWSLIVFSLFSRASRKSRSFGLDFRKNIKRNKKDSFRKH